jgi:hypothetical protein
MTSFPPWEPPFDGDETGAVFGALDRQRTTFRWKCADLDARALAATTAASTLTLGGLLKHLALIEDYYVQVKILGGPLPSAWDAADWDTDGWEFASAAQDSPEDLYALWDSAVARSRAAVEEIERRGGLGAAAAQTLPDGGAVNVRRMVLDLIEEYGRHTGHADILREAVDGRTGEDPPWPPPDVLSD